jgi:hypothetical protein
MHFIALIAAIVIAGLIINALLSPDQTQIQAEKDRQWKIAEEEFLRDTSDILIKTLTKDKGFTPEQIATIQKSADDTIKQGLKQGF